MHFHFFSSEALPKTFRQNTDYLVGWNDYRIVVGDKLRFANGTSVAVTKLWTVIGQKLVETDVMEPGHNSLVRFDRSIGTVDVGTPYAFEKIGG